MPGERPRAHGDVDAVTAALPLSPRLPDAPVGALAHAAPCGDAPKAPGDALPGERDDHIARLYTMKTQPVGRASRQVPAAFVRCVVMIRCGF